MGGGNLIRQLAEPLTSRLWGDGFAHTPTLSNTYAKHRRPALSLWTETQLGTTRRQHSNMSEPDGKRPRLLPRHREVEPLLGRDQVVVAVLADVELHPLDLTGEPVAGRAVVR